MERIVTHIRRPSCLPRQTLYTIASICMQFVKIDDPQETVMLYDQSNPESLVEKG
jgi:hypothetical protein